MKPTILIPENYLDLIFFNRNKNYGAYALRKNYPTTIVKSIGVVMTSLLVSVLFSLLHKSEKLDNHIAGQIVCQLHDIRPQIILPSKPSLPSAPSHVTNHAPTVPQIVHDELTTTKPDISAEVTQTSIASNGATNTSGEGLKGNGESNNAILRSHNQLSNYKPIRWSEEMPKFQGDINQYLASHIQYPEMAKSANIQGKVIIEFVVDEQGNISSLRLVKGIGGGCDEEAINVIKNMPQWIPGKQNGSPVKIYMVLPITFTLN